MPNTSKRIFVSLVVVAAVYKSSTCTFLHSTGRHVRPNMPTATMPALAASGAAAAMMNADGAMAYGVDASQVEKSARIFADAAYPLMQKIEWVGYNPFVPFLESAPWTPQQLAAALKSVFAAGMEMDPALVRTAVMAHEKALRTVIDGGKVMSTKEDVEDVFEAVARLISSAGDAKIQAVYDAVMPMGVDKLNLAMVESLGGVSEVAGPYNAFLDTMTAASSALRA